MSQVSLAAFRYAPAIGGAENHTRRWLRQIGSRLEVDVFTLVTTQRTDWLRALIEVDRERPERYEIDGRSVTALAGWPMETRRGLWLLAPAYHIPASPAPWLMGRLLAGHLHPVVASAQLLHNVFMGREAFSAGLMLAAERAGVPFVFTPLRHQRPLGWNSPAFRRLYQRSDALIALTQGEADWLVQQGADRARVHVIGIGPLNDPSAPVEPAVMRLGDNRKIVLFLGQLHRYKGFEAVLGAAKLLEHRLDVQFVFAGPDVRGHAAVFANGRPGVTWLGKVSDELRDSLLCACTIVCVPSSRESFGGVVVEAWSCGKPVIGGPAPATHELIEDGVDGFVVPQDPQVIADRLTRLLDDPRLAQIMGARGREKVRQKYSWDAIAQAHVDLYQTLTK